MGEALTTAEANEVTSSELGAHPGEILDRVRYSRTCLTVTRNGRPVAMLVPIQDQLERAAEQNQGQGHGR